jgi:hypothetical protein
VLLHFFPIAHAPIDDDAGKAARLGRECRQTAKRRNAFARIIDDENIPRRGRLDHIADLEIFRPEVAALSRDLTHGHRPADAARAWHDLAQPDHDAGKGNIIERIGDRWRRQLRILHHNVIGDAHSGSSLGPTPRHGDITDFLSPPRPAHNRATPPDGPPEGPRASPPRGARPPKCLQG